MAVNSGLQSFFNFFIFLTGVTRGHVVSPGRLSGFSGITNLEISGEGGAIWHYALTPNSLRVFRGAHPKPRGTVLISVDEFFKLLTKQSSFVTAQLTGRVRITGEVHSGLVLLGILDKVHAARKKNGLPGTIARWWTNRIIRKSKTGYAFI